MEAGFIPPYALPGQRIYALNTNPDQNLLTRLTDTYKVNLYWFLTGKGPSGLESDTVKIELLEQEAATALGREAEGYAGRRIFQIPHSLIASHNPDRLLAVHVAGDSMVEAHICDGDITIFHPGITIFHPGITGKPTFS
jgi:SOS-response transcriptional repressor LexA